MDYPFYLSLVHYLSHNQYLSDCTKKVKRKIRFHVGKYMLEGGRLFKRTQDPQVRGEELLHEGTANDVIHAVHTEGHFEVNNTWRQVRMAYTGPGLFEKVRSLVQSFGCDAVGPIKSKGKADRLFDQVADRSGSQEYQRRHHGKILV
ncbi:hypothetical protein BJV82DRAFT_706014 [Fennellomyces sp. T-0311]|nr:hypothetical protein BJV82DRAFT_706014 [Fennellomyces sp. T-0311]